MFAFQLISLALGVLFFGALVSNPQDTAGR
jgi:hypothetical protein